MTVDFTEVQELLKETEESLEESIDDSSFYSALTRNLKVLLQVMKEAETYKADLEEMR